VRYYVEAGNIVWYGEALDAEAAAFRALEMSLPSLVEGSVSVYELRDPIIFDAMHSIKIARREKP
jgi:hypothetical protein